MQAHTKLGRRRVPWCSVVLVLGVAACHTCVLVGNFQTAATLDALSASAKGWSKVGLGVGRSFRIELDRHLLRVSQQLVQVLPPISQIQKAIDGILSLAGAQIDAALLQVRRVLMLQGPPGSGSAGSPRPGLLGDLEDAAVAAVDLATQELMTRLLAGLDALLLQIRPPLVQAAQWVGSFGARSKAKIEAFGASLDRAQRLLDEVMARLSSRASGMEAQMLYETFGLFDVDGSGLVSADDLQKVGTLYSIEAFHGRKPAELVARHGAGGQLGPDGMLRLVRDPSIPKVMTVLMRTYAKKMSEMGSDLAGARTRSEAALVVARYLQVVCLKNATRVLWIADALGNGSLPLPFSAAVLAQLCLDEDNPALLTTMDVGQRVVATLGGLHPAGALEAVDLMSNTTWWYDNGFNPLDQPRCAQRVAAWVASAAAGGPQAAAAPPAGPSPGAPVALASLGSRGSREEAARQAAERRSWAFLAERRQARGLERAALFSSASSRALAQTLLGGAAAGDGDAAAAGAERAVRAGQPARPETLRWAQWLSNNLTRIAKLKQELCFNYSGESSGRMDAFATQIQGVVRGVRTVTIRLKKWGSPAGVDRLEGIARRFAQRGAEDLRRAVRARVRAALAGALLEGAVAGQEPRQAIEAAVNRSLVSARASPLGGGGGRDLGSAAGAPGGRAVPAQRGSAGALEEAAAQALQVAVGDARGRWLPGAAGGASLLAGAGSAWDEEPHGLLELAGAWPDLAGALRSLAGALPAAVRALTRAREQTARVAANMESVFSVLDAQGPNLLDRLAARWRRLCVAYFAALMPLGLFLLYYGFWAGGFFGGPVAAHGREEFVPPKGWRERLRLCCTCLGELHDSPLCVWSALVLMQVVALFVLAVATFMSVVAGVRALAAFGCGQVLVLADPTVCAESMRALRDLLGTFYVSEADEALDDICPSNHLLVCRQISSRMKASIVLTSVFGFVGAMLTLQMILESAVLHEQARYRRMLDAKRHELGP